MKTSKLKKKNVQRKLSTVTKLYDKIIKMPSKFHETIPLIKILYCMTWKLVYSASKPANPSLSSASVIWDNFMFRICLLRESESDPERYLKKRQYHEILRILYFSTVNQLRLHYYNVFYFDLHFSDIFTNIFRFRAALPERKWQENVWIGFWCGAELYRKV
jgi:hypothetical protein